MKRIRIVGLLTFLVVLLVIGGCAAPAAPAEFPTEKNVTWIITHSPGGGYDTYSRALSPTMTGYLGTGIAVKNVPGAGGVVGTNVVYRAEPDGYTVGLISIPGQVITQILSDVEFDMGKMEYIGCVGIDSYSLSVRPDSPFKTVEDLRNAEKPIRVGHTGGGTGSFISILVPELWDIPYVSVGGFKGSVECILGVMRGDLDVVIVGAIPTHWEYVKSGDLRPMFTLTRERHELLPDTPTVIELGGPDVLAEMGLYRILCTTPGVPKERVKILEDALMKTLEDEDILNWSKKVGRPLNPLTGEESRRITTGALDLYTQYKDVLAQYFE